MSAPIDYLDQAKSLQEAIEHIHAGADDLTADGMALALNSASHLMTAYANVSIAQSLESLAKLAARLDPLLTELEKSMAYDDHGNIIRPIEDHT